MAPLMLNHLVSRVIMAWHRSQGFPVTLGLRMATVT